MSCMWQRKNLESFYWRGSPVIQPPLSEGRLPNYYILKVSEISEELQRIVYCVLGDITRLAVLSKWTVPFCLLMHTCHTSGSSKSATRRFWGLLQFPEICIECFLSGAKLWRLGWRFLKVLTTHLFAHPKRCKKYFGQNYATFDTWKLRGNSSGFLTFAVS